MNVFQSIRRVILLLKSFFYLSTKFVGKFIFNRNGMVGFWFVVDGVEGSDRVSGSDKDVSDEISIGSFTKVCSHLWQIVSSNVGDVVWKLGD